MKLHEMKKGYPRGQPNSFFNLLTLKPYIKNLILILCSHVTCYFVFMLNYV